MCQPYLLLTVESRIMITMWILFYSGNSYGFISAEKEIQGTPMISKNLPHLAAILWF